MAANKPHVETAGMLAAARDNMLVYAMLTHGKYQPYAWHKFVARKLEAAIERGQARIIIHAPPQHGKTMLISQVMPAFIMGRHPDWPIMAGSYGTDLAEENGQAVRDRIGSAPHAQIFPESRLDAATTAKKHFKTTQGGIYFGTTVRGGGTGFPSKVFIIDDPFKSRDEADSETVRQATKNWYTSVVYPRIAEDSILIVMHTRWHEDDLAGWLMREHPTEDWEHIYLPAIAMANDQMGRQEGEALCPERFSAAALEKKRVAVGSRDWEALFQGRPVAGTGGKLKRAWLRQYEEIPVTIAKPMNRYIIVDPAGSKGKKNDYTSIVVIGLNIDGNKYLLDAVRDKLSLKERADTLIRMRRKWLPLKVGYEKYGKDSDIEHIQSKQAEINYRFDIVELGGKMAKEARIERLIPDLETGKWWFPTALIRTGADNKPVDVMERFINEEYLPFPAGLHDDMLDAIARIYEPVMEATFPKPPENFAAIAARGNEQPFAW